MEIVLAIIGAAGTIIVAFIGADNRREYKKRKEYREKADKRAAIRTEESRLAMNLISANTNLGIVTGIAVKNGEVNGEMDKAVQKAEKAQSEYFKFVNGMAAKYKEE
jgi:hypothetical protein